MASANSAATCPRSDARVLSAVLPSSPATAWVATARLPRSASERDDDAAPAAATRRGQG